MNAIAPRRRPAPPALSDALPRLINAPGITLTWRPAVVAPEHRLAIARLLLAGTGYTVKEPAP